MPAAIMKLGLTAALEDFCQRINQQGLLRLNFQAYNVSEENLTVEISAVIYRIVQELVQNILKPAAAQQALVQLIGNNTTLSITVEDDGKGFAPGGLKTGDGIGFSNLKNRVIYLNGTLDIVSAPGKGTSITSGLPNSII